jgi:RNA polymerase sigma factor (sigma-70 family)
MRPESTPPSCLPEALPPEVERAVRAVWRRLQPRLPSDLLEDCRQEVRLLLWSLADRLRDLPEGERRPFLRFCVIRHVWACLQAELRERGETVSLDALLDIERQPAGLRDGAAEDLADRVAKTLLDRLDLPDLIAAYVALPPHPRLVLDLYYGQGLSDPEVAALLGVPADRVRQQRHRAIARLAAALRKEG